MEYRSEESDGRSYDETGNHFRTVEVIFIMVGMENPCWHSILDKAITTMVLLACLNCPTSASAQLLNQQQSDLADQSSTSNQGSLLCSDEWLSRLQEEVENGPLKKSLSALEAQSIRCAGNAQYHVVLSIALQKNGRPAKAAVEMDEAIKLDPHRAESFFRLAQILFENGDLGGARVLLLRANEEFPDQTWIYLFLSTVLDKLGAISEEEQLLDTAAKRWPRLPEVHILRGNMLSATGQHARAIGEYRTALRISPELPQAYLFYGIELDKLQRSVEALTALKECVRLAPLMANSHYYLGALLLKKGDLTNAARELETAIKIDPQYALVYFRLGKAYQEMGDRNRAQDYMGRYGVLLERQKSEDASRTEQFRKDLTSYRTR